MIMSKPKCQLFLVAVVTSVVALSLTTDTYAQAYPNPYRQVEDWAKLPTGREMGAVGGVTVDRDYVENLTVRSETISVN